ncbi:MAG: TolC family protein [Bdellovibrionales bacterium]|nr:TolC family protein [Bdellovibrionales bacterium]
MFLKVIARSSLLITLVVLSGCYNSLKEVDGDYAGDFSRIENGKLTTARVATRVNPLSNDDSDFFLELTDQASQRKIAHLEVRRLWGNKFTVRSNLLNGNEKIRMQAHGTCADEVATQKRKVTSAVTTICAQKDVISLFSTDQSGKYRVFIYLTKVGKETPDEKGTGKYSLNDLFSRVMTDNYESRVASEKLYQSHQEIKLFRSQLYPSLSLATVVSFIANPLFSVSTIGSLVPFVFPTNWFRFDTRRATYQAEVMAYKSLVANQMSLTEDIYHQIIRDRRAIETLKSIGKSIDERRLIVAQNVELGLAPDTDLFEFEDLFYKNRTDIGKLEQGLVTQYAILSRGVGLSPRDGIKELVEPKVQPDLSALKPLNPEDLMAAAKSGSLEIRQGLFLENAAAFHVNAETFSFINPGEWISLSAGIFHRVKIAKSALKSVTLLREQTELSVESNVIALCATYNQLLEQSRDLDKNIENRKKVLDRTEQNYRAGTASALQVRGVLEGMQQLEIERSNLQSAFAVVSGKVDRLLWQKEYLKALQLDVKQVTF